MNQKLYKSYQDLGESQGLFAVATAHILGFGKEGESGIHM